MNGYKAFYKGKSIEVYAKTSFKAHELAAQKFKAKKSYEVTVMLCETNVVQGVGTQVVHSTSSL